MHGCTSGIALVVNAELDSMGGVGISSTPSLQQSSDLEKTQAELRQTFSAAEKFRRELEFLQNGGDPLDLKPANAASISFQSTSPIERHPEQFVTSEAKGSSAESSGRLGAPSVCEPNSADNLMLFDGDSKSNDLEKRSTILELPKKSYRRRVRSRPSRDAARSSSTDAFRHVSNDSSSKPKSPSANVDLKNSISHLENDLDGMPAVQSSLGPAHGPYSGVLNVNDVPNTRENHLDLLSKSDGRDAPLTMASTEPKSVSDMEQAHLTDSKRPLNADIEVSETPPIPGPANGFGNAEEIKSRHDDSKSSDIQNSRRFDDYNGPLEQNLKGNDVGAEKNDKLLNIDKDSSDIYHSTQNKDGSAMKEEGVKGSESALHADFNNSVCIKETEIKTSILVGPNSLSQDENACSSIPQGSNDTHFQESTDGAEQNACSQDNLKLATKEREDSILEEARIIEAKRKRIAELSARPLPLEGRLKSHWDFVLEEMSWLANDFAQERLWKVTAAAQISRRAAFASHLRLQRQVSVQKQKEVSHTLAEAILQFWHTIQMKCKGQESHNHIKDHEVGIQRYAMKFVKHNSSEAEYKATQAPVTHDSISDLQIMDHSWEDNLTEENLFYQVPPGAIEAYRKAIDSHLLQFEKTGSGMQEEVDTSCHDAVADNAFEVEEGETNTYYLPGVHEGSKSTQPTQKRRKNFQFYGGRAYEMEGDLTFSSQPPVLSGKRSGSNLNVAIPTKRVRTASRPRTISPYNAGTSGNIQAPNRTDASSGDTNSFQDEQSTLHGGAQIPNNNMEAESVGDYEKQLQFDSMEISNRPKKKKKIKHSGSTFEHRWQLDSNFQNDQKDHSRRRLDTHQFDSNGSSVASQMSNMSNPNKIMKLLARDRGRKVKALKTPAGQPGSGSPWSLFEDQALVVLVHDMGPNWELISDAINSTLQFKCIFRKSKECKERHKILMDRNTGDGADSAEDSGSSQPYPSTLPGIPEGSARQLFQRLQGPMEEDTLKTHFEKIIIIGQKQHYRRTQNDNQDPKQLQQPHSSHAFALSQVFPNNLNNGGPVLTPLELLEAMPPTPDTVPAGFQGPHSGGLPPMLPGSGSGSTSAPASSGSVHGNNLPAGSSSLNPSAREGRYGNSRTGSLSVDDQQRIQQYNQMISARNAQQSNLAPGSHAANDRGVRTLPPGNGVGAMGGMNRNMKMARPGFQGIPSPSMMSSSGTATPTSASMHSGPGNSMLRPRDAMHMMRPNQNADQQVSQSGTTQGVPAFASGTNSSFPNQFSQPPVQAYPRPISPHQSPHGLSSNSHHPHHFQGPPNHATNTQHPAYAARLAKERQLQQQRLLLQQQQFAQQDSQLPVSSPQNTARSSSPPVSMTPKHLVPPPNGLVRNPQTSGSQLVKQHRQRPSQQFQQPHQQRLQVPPQQQAKLMKGGRGNMVVPNDSSLVNGFSGTQSTAGKQSVPHSVSQQHQQKKFSGQVQTALSKNPSDSSDSNSNNQNHAPSVAASSINHQQHQSLLNQKLLNQKQASSPHKLLLNRKVNTSDQPPSKLQAQTESLTTAVQSPHAPCTNANSSEIPVVSSPAAPDNAETQMSPPQTSGARTESEHFGQTVNQVTVHNQSSSDSLPDTAGHESGVQRQQQQQQLPS